jgi:MFS family permease
VLGYGGFLLLGGRTADLVGQRTTLLIALAVFSIASVIGGLVSDPNLLLAARFMKGASAAFSAPAGLSIITTAFAEGPERNRAVSLYAATGASGFSLGLVVGGLTTAAGWRLAPRRSCATARTCRRAARATSCARSEASDRMGRSSTRSGHACCGSCQAG